MIINIHQATQIHLCRWCNRFFIPIHKNQIYCSEECRYQSSLERSRIYKAKVREEQQLKEKLLGTSNIREHRNKDFSRELEIVRKEKRRLLK